MPRHVLPALLATGALATGAGTALAHDRGHGHGHGKGHGHKAVPETIALPAGWQPEGIASGPRHTVFAGSIGQGAVYVADVRTGAGRVLVPPHAGRNHTGLKYDRSGHRLFVAGGASGGLYVYDARTGGDVAAFPVGGGFVNDVALTGRTAYFTDSRKPVLYAVDYTRQGVGQPRTIPLTGITYGDGNNANGLVVAHDGSLITVQSNTGKLWRIAPATGAATEIDLGGATLTNGDGLLLVGRHKLAVVQNRDNKVTIVKLAKDLGSGVVAGSLTDPDFAIPTTLAAQDHALYTVNAKFGTPPAGTPYEIVRVGAAAAKHGKRGGHHRGAHRR